MVTVWPTRNGLELYGVDFMDLRSALKRLGFKVEIRDGVLSAKRYSDGAHVTIGYSRGRYGLAFHRDELGFGFKHRVFTDRVGLAKLLERLMKEA